MTNEGHENVQNSPVRGDVIRQLRESMNDGAGMPRHKFAAAADISPSTLQRAEEREPGTNTTTLRKIAKVLGVPLSTIYADDALADIHLPSDAPPAWLQQLSEQLDARLSAIEARQHEILRRLEKR